MWEVVRVNRDVTYFEVKHTETSRISGVAFALEDQAEKFATYLNQKGQ